MPLVAENSEEEQNDEWDVTVSERRLTVECAILTEELRKDWDYAISIVKELMNLEIILTSL